MSQTRDDIRLEQIPEVRLRGGQIVGWAVVVLVLVLVAFFMGYATGRRAEKRRSEVRGEMMSKLISRLELYSRETRQMVAKEKLSEARRAAQAIRDIDEVQPRVRVVRAHREARSLAVAKVRRGRVVRLKPSRKRRSGPSALQATSRRTRTGRKDVVARR